jgi:hypothetical protein
MIKFDKKKFLALLKEKKKVAQEGKFFWDFDSAKNTELISYITFLEDQIFWQSPKEYCKMLDLFISKTITLDELFDGFFTLRASNIKAAKMVEDNFKAEACGILTKSNNIDFQLNSESIGFRKIIDYLFANQNYFIFSLYCKTFTIL